MTIEESEKREMRPGEMGARLDQEDGVYWSEDSAMRLCG